MKIYDCFAFFNELDVLELRLRELNDVVDYFVLVEATRSFQKKPKPLFYAENKARFAAYHDKIIHVVVDQYPNFWTHFRPVKTWDYDSHQKEQILQGLSNAAPNDLIIVSDLDEIPLREKISEFKNKPGIRVFEQFQSYYFLNYVCTRIHDYGGKAVAQKNREGFGRWRGSVMLEYHLIENIEKTRCFRDQEGPHIHVIENGGWHFSYMGGIEKILYKIKSWAHKEYNNSEFNSPEVVLNNILEGKDLFKENMKYELFELNDPRLPFPTEIKQNPETYKSLLRNQSQLKEEISSLLAKVENLQA